MARASADARLMAAEVEDEEVRATPREGLGARLVITYWCARNEQDWCPESRKTMIMMFVTKAGQFFDWWWALFDHRAAENGG